MLINYILVFWVFLTNVLILNMLIAMMNTTFSQQEKNVHAVWLLDVSYRIMRFEKLFPELKDRMRTSRAELKNTMHTSRSQYSVLNKHFWQQLLWDMCLVLYCLPEIHIWGFSHAAFVWICRMIKFKSSRDENGLNTPWNTTLENLSRTLNELTASEVNQGSGRPMEGHSFILRRADELKGLGLDQRVMGIALLEAVREEVNSWFSLFDSRKDQVLVVKKPLPGPEVQIDNVHTTLLYISLIYRLDLLAQNFDASCIVHDVRQQRAAA
jgi:hypothetical protein